MLEVGAFSVWGAVVNGVHGSLERIYPETLSCFCCFGTFGWGGGGVG